MLVPNLNRVFAVIGINKYSRKDIKRFIRHIKVNKETGCWEWIGYLDKDGYGQFSIILSNMKKMVKSHRLAFSIFHNIVIISEMCVCHTCDNPKCCNPNHLWLGTNLDNTQDMMNKGRGNQASGENHGRAKLDWISVREIRRLHTTGKYTYPQLSEMFNISYSSINFVVNNRTWKV